MKLCQSYTYMSIPNSIEQDNEVMPELHMIAPSCIGQGYEVIPELDINAPNYIE